MGVKLILQDQNIVLLRLDKGEEVFEKLLLFASENNVTAATFNVIGASQEVVLAYYDLPKKEYLDHTLAEDLEIVSVTGNVGIMDNKPIIHAHGVFSNKKLQTYGGHIKKLVVSATCEVTLTKLDGELTRDFDEETGFNLLQ